MPPIRVLLAHPDGDVVSASRDYLEREGFSVATATSGLECLAQLRACSPDALVLEMDLLWGGGEGVLARLGEDGDLPRVPVVILSSRSARFGPSTPAVPIAERMASPPAPPLLARTIRAYVQLQCPEQGRPASSN